MSGGDIVKFRLSLAVAIGGLTSLLLADPPRALWVGNVVETEAAAVYTVLRVYGGDDDGSHIGMNFGRASFQHDTRGIDEGLVLAQAWAIHESLKKPNGVPQQYWIIAGQKFDGTGAIVADDTGGADTGDGSGGGNNWEVRTILFNGRPGIRGRLDERWLATGNFDVEFMRTSESPS